MPSEEIVARIPIRKTDTLADLGAGIGYFTFPAAERAKSVVAVDMEPAMLEVLSSRLRSRRVKNVLPLLGEILHMPLREGSVDGILAACVYHEVDSQERLVTECLRILRPGGILTIVDFQKRKTSFGPPVRERKSPAQVIEVAGRNMRLVSRYDSPVFYQLSFMKTR
jgi:ubiquinone/menaquinone biosynthesis C-methylase UbiE